MQLETFPAPVQGIVEPGRKNVRDMTDRELLEELVTDWREALDNLKQFMEALEGNPMLKAFMG